jgi:hypothetical protein
MLLSLLDENDIENAIENNTKLLDYFADRITVQYMTVKLAFGGCPYSDHSILSEIDSSAEFILLYNIQVDKDCPIFIKEKGGNSPAQVQVLRKDLETAKGILK